MIVQLTSYAADCLISTISSCIWLILTVLGHNTVMHLTDGPTLSSSFDMPSALPNQRKSDKLNPPAKDGFLLSSSFVEALVTANLRKICTRCARVMKD